MNQLQKIFDYQGAKLRTIIIDGEPWFVAKDVCVVLEIDDTGKAISRLDVDEGTRIKIDHPQSPGKTIEVYAVNEPGLYSLILGSRKQESKAFKRWITHDVLPSIRKTGQYIASEKVVPMDERKARIELFKTAIEHEERIESVERKIVEIDRKVKEQITLTSGEQRKLQKEVAKRVYELARIVQIDNWIQYYP